jgi:hypothetical protein
MDHRLLYSRSDLVVVAPNDPGNTARVINSLPMILRKRKRIAPSGHAKVVAQYTQKHLQNLCLFDEFFHMTTEVPLLFYVDPQ